MKMVMSWKSILIGLLLVVPLWVSLIIAASAQSTLPAHEVDVLLCRMALGNAQDDAEARKNLYAVIYAAPDATLETGRYGLLSGIYSGNRGASHFGPTMDDPQFPRYFADGTEAHDYMAQHLRAITSEFRQGLCDRLVPPEPTPKS